MDNVNTLNDIIGNYVGKYIKLGGKCGFFFCGFIPDNYNELFEDVKIMVSDQIAKNKARIEEELKDFDRQWEMRREKREKNPTFFDQKEIELFEANKNHARIILEGRLQRAEDALCSVPSILSYPVAETYKSTIDNATIILLDCAIKGSVSNRAEMLKKPTYHDIVKKYKV